MRTEKTHRWYIVKLHSFKLRSQLSSALHESLFTPQTAALQPRTVLFTLQQTQSAHCASETTADLLSENRSVNLTRHRLSKTVIL